MVGVPIGVYLDGTYLRHQIKVNFSFTILLLHPRGKSPRVEF